jgi:hypothetical protein
MYQTCPKQYEFSYLHTFEYERQDSLSLLQGTILHEVLRWLYQNISFFTLPTKEEMLTYFQSQRSELLPQHNFLDLADQTVKEASQITKHQLSQYYDKYFPFEQETLIGLEQKLFAKLSVEEFSFSVTLDRVAKQGDTFIIYDYKTNRNLTPELQTSHREQMYLYARALQQNYGKYFSQIEIRLQYLALQKEEVWTIDAEEMETILQKYTQWCREITEKKEQYALQQDDTIFPPHKAEHCRRCVFMNICPAFTALSENFDIASLTSESVQHLVKEYARDYQLIKSLETEKETLKEQLESFFQHSDYQRIFGTEYQITYAQRDNRTIKDIEQVESVLADKELLDTSRSLDKTKLKNLIALGNIPSDLAQE